MIVRTVESNSAGLGVEQLSAGDLALIYTAGLSLLDVNESDRELAEALEAIAETMYGEPATQPKPGDWNRFLHPLNRRRRNGAASRSSTPEPARRLRTNHRAAAARTDPPRLGDRRRSDGPEGNLRTYILSNVRSAELLEETFEPAAQSERLLESQRKSTTVRMELTQDARWAADMYAERVALVEQDESKFVADLQLLPPLATESA